MTILGIPTDPIHRQRIDALAASYARLAALTTTPADTPDGHDLDLAEAGDLAESRGLAEAIHVLAAAGRLAVEGDGPWRLAYIPSHTALTTVAEGGPYWGSTVDGKQRKAIRWLTGAVFRLPLADKLRPTNELPLADEPGDVTAFITDWSPFPAACAVAVHPGHELAGGGTTPYFTGRFVRHPLVGDLLPVWVADWVKPEFGTGAVIVNPAHSAADLEFARAVGLPVRFGLAATPPTADAATWPEPPVVKSGVAVRTGSFDGLDPASAADAYFAALAAGGFASAARLPMIGRHAIGVAAAARPFTGGEPVAVAAEPVIELALDPPPHLLVTPDAVEELLWIRLLRLDLGLTGRPSRATVVARADLGKTAEAPDVALLAAGPPDRVAAVKPQLIEQARRLIDEHSAALSRPNSDAEPSAAGRTILEALRAGDLPGAFQHAYGLHKDVKRAAVDGYGDVAAYALAVHVLLAAELPQWLGPDDAAKLLA